MDSWKNPVWCKSVLNIHNILQLSNVRKTVGESEKKNPPRTEWMNTLCVRLYFALTSVWQQDICKTYAGSEGCFFFLFVFLELTVVSLEGLAWSEVKWSVVPGLWWCSLKINLITKLLTPAVSHSRLCLPSFVSRASIFLPGKSGQRRPALCNECVARDGFVEGKVKFERVVM